MLILKINKKNMLIIKIATRLSIVGLLCKVNSPKRNIYVMRILSVFLTPKKKNLYFWSRVLGPGQDVIKNRVSDPDLGPGRTED